MVKARLVSPHETTVQTNAVEFCIGSAFFSQIVQLNTPPALAEEELFLYTDFLDSFGKVNFQFLADRTFPIEKSSLGDATPCLRGIQLETTDKRSESHTIGSAIRGHSTRLVSEQEERAILNRSDARVGTGTTDVYRVLALSEILFDKKHQFTVIKYVILCGSRCNSGATLVLHRMGSHWEVDKSRRPCAFVLNESDPRR